MSKPDTFSFLIDRYQEAFLRKARSILGGREDSEDIVQDTFVKIYINAAKFKPVPGASFKSWGYRILINTCFTKYQKIKKIRKYTSNLEEEIVELVPDIYHTKEMEQRLDKDYLLSLISKLPNLLRKPVTMHFIEGKPQKDIAKMEGVSENVVRTRIHRAKKALKKFGLHVTY